MVNDVVKVESEEESSTDNDTKTLNALVVVPDSGLQSYIQQVNQVPVLTLEEEQALARRYRDEGDLLAAQQLVLSHMRYVVRIARTYKGYGLAMNDLIQEGAIGLMKAVKRFDPDVGVRLVSFAVHWVKAEIHEYIIRNWRIVKVATTKAQRKLFFKLRGEKKRLGWFTHEEVIAVANDLGVKPKDVLEMESRLNAHSDITFDAPDNEEDTEYQAPAYYLEAPKSNPADILASNDAFEDMGEKLSTALTLLDQRSLDIVSQRWLKDEKMTLKDLADKYKISVERVRQLEKAAFSTLQESIQNADGDVEVALN